MPVDVAAGADPLLQMVLDRLPGATLQADGNWAARCPAHEDKNPSLHVRMGDKCVLFDCKAGCDSRGIVELLGLSWRDLFRNPRDARRHEPLPHTVGWCYYYQDETGQVLYRVQRGRPTADNPKPFYQNPSDGHGGWRKGPGIMKGIRRVLYRLPELLAADPKAPVFVTEGEKDCDNVRALGLVAVTNAGGAIAKNDHAKWLPEFSELLRGRRVVLLADNDASGRTHTRTVARRLAGIAAEVRIVEFQNLVLPQKDVSDWIANGGTARALIAMAEATQPLPGENAAGTGQLSAKLLVTLALESGVELFHDQRSVPFAAIRDDTGRRIVSVGSTDFGLWLRRLIWNRSGKTMGRDLVTTARDTLGSIARFDKPQRDLFVRVARHDGAIWVDLDGRSAVRVTADGWTIDGKPPILFRSFAHQRPLPHPSRNGDLGRCLDYVRIADTEDNVPLLFQCYLVAAMVPDIPVAAMIVHGQHGATKSTVLKIVKRLLDPGAVEVQGGMRDQAEFAQAAAQNRVLFFDNLTSVPEWLSDLLCCFVTGAGFSKRMLYSDDDSVTFEYRGVAGLGGVNLVADRPDLLDRSIIIKMEPVPDSDRRAEGEFWDEFEADRPAILGGIFDALSTAMRIEPTLQLARLPRMADFARWGAAASVAIGRTAEEFLDAYRANIGRQNDAAIESSPIAGALIRFMEYQVEGEWNGTAGELLSELEARATDLKINTRARGWPKNAVWVGRRLRDVMPNLLARGVAVEEKQGRMGSTFLLRRGSKSGGKDSTYTDSTAPNQQDDLGF